MENLDDKGKAGEFIQSYLSQSFVIISEGKRASFNYVGKEVTVRDELFFYFTFTQVSDPSHIFIRNSVLFELFSNQQNIIHYTFNGNIKGTTLHADKPTGEIEI